MARFALAGPALGLVCLAATGCTSASEPSTSSPASVAAPGPAPTTEPTAAGSPSAATGDAPGNGSGTITITGKVSGTATIRTCAEGDLVQLIVRLEGRDEVLAGLMDADDFTFAVPGTGGYTLADDASKPEVSGKTYTLDDARLIGVTTDDTATANGSVTCP